MKTAVIGYATALCLALVGAYQTWTHEGEADLSGATVILDVQRDDIEAIVYEGPSGQVRLEMRSDELGDYVWASVTAEETTSAFKAGPAGENIAQGMAPFVAKRVLEGVDEGKLEELGFGEGQASLTFGRSGREPKVYEVGAKAYGGSNRYVRDPEGGTLYIVAANLIDTLETAERTLPDRSVVGFDVTDIDTITVRGGEAEAAFVQNNPDDRAARFWSLQGASEPNPAAAGWFDKALRMRVSTYLAEQPAGLDEAFSMTVASGRQSVEVVVYRAAGDGGEEQWFASSPHNRGWVQLHSSSAAEVYADLTSVLAAGA